VQDVQCTRGVAGPSLWGKGEGEANPVWGRGALYESCHTGPLHSNATDRPPAPSRGAYRQNLLLWAPYESFLRNYVCMSAQNGVRGKDALLLKKAF